MRLHIYYRYIHNFDFISKNNKKRDKRWYLDITKKTQELDVKSILILEFITNQYYCYKNSKVTIRNSNLFYTIDNLFNSLYLKNNKKHLWTYFFNNILGKKLNIKLDSIINILNISFKFIVK